MSSPTLKQQCRWLQEQVAMRQHWLAEGLRGGHSYESLLRYKADLSILTALLDTLHTVAQGQMALFDQEA